MIKQENQQIYCRNSKFLILTVSNKDDVTAALVNVPALMFARTGAPKPIEESCRLAENIRDSSLIHQTLHKTSSV